MPQNRWYTPPMSARPDCLLPLSAMAATCTCCSMSVDWWVRLRSHPDLPICHNCLAGLNGQRDGQLQLMTRNMADHGVRSDLQGLQRDSFGRLVRRVQASKCRSTMTPMPSLTGIGTSRSTLSKLKATNLPATVRSTSTVKTPIGWLTEWRQAGIEVDGPRDEDYGKREGSIADPDGNVIRFGSPIR